MIINKCNRCGIDIENYDSFAEMQYYDSNNTSQVTKTILCEDCYNNVKKYIDGYQKEIEIANNFVSALTESEKQQLQEKMDKINSSYLFTPEMVNNNIIDKILENTQYKFTRKLYYMCNYVSQTNSHYGFVKYDIEPNEKDEYWINIFDYTYVDDMGVTKFKPVCKKIYYGDRFYINDKNEIVIFNRNEIKNIEMQLNYIDEE